MGILKLALAFLLFIAGCNNISAGQPSHERDDLESTIYYSSYSAESEATTANSVFKRKKKQKGSSKMKRHNKSMGKKFKKKNEDSLRDRLQ